MNNIFKFATTELSQDAFICWCINFFNYDCNLKKLSIDLLKKFNIKNIDKIDSIKILKQFQKIDILLILNGINTAVIIEDKTYTSEHNNQIENYVNSLKKSGSNNHLNINENTKIVVVYFKTGFLFENDKNTVYNIQNNHKYNGALVTGNDFKIILEKYKGINYLLDSYLYNLCENLEKENHYRLYYKKDNSEQWNISTSQIAQYEFINSLFPENWRKYKNPIFKINTRHNNSCYPFTYIDIEYIDECYFQWRVDTNKTGPFLELKMYNKYDKRSEEQKNLHILKYRKYKDIIKDIIISNNIFEFDVISTKRNSESCFNPTFIHISLEPIFNSWKTKEDETVFINKIQTITTKFINKVK